MTQERRHYQHRVTVWNYDTGKVTYGCFKTRDEAEAFKDSTEGDEKSYSADFNNWPYGTFEQSFNPEAHIAAMWDEAEFQRSAERNGY